MPKKKSTVEKVKITKAVTRLSRTKHSLNHCVYCGKETKMALVGEMENAKGKTWYKCTRCRHMSLLEPKIKEDIGTLLGGIDVSSCIPYKPDMSYSVGQFIFHSELNDAGRVMSKLRTSNGGNAIQVTFQNVGKKTFIESLKGDSQFGSF